MTKQEKIDYFADKLSEKGISESSIAEFNRKAKKIRCHRSADYFIQWTGCKTADGSKIFEIWNGIDFNQSVYICAVS